jgi:osmoprotectant transport system substrate-binding protein
MRMHRLLPVGAAVLALGLVLTACGDDDASSTSSSSEPTAADKGAVTVITAGFTEIDVMANIYKELLEKSGYDVTVKKVGTREQYLDQISAGKEDIVPDYLGSATNFMYSQEQKNPDAVVATADVAKTLAEARRLAEPQKLVVLNPAEATDQNAYAVTKEFAAQHDLKTLSDLGASGLPIVIAAPEECKTRPLCGVGLEKTYGIDITEYKPFPFGSATSKKEVTSGKAQLVQVSTTGTPLDQFGLVILEDDKGLQPAENLTPILGSASKIAGDEDAIALLNKLSETLTTADLAELNDAVDTERERAEDVAANWLESVDLI